MNTSSRSNSFSVAPNSFVLFSSEMFKQTRWSEPVTWRKPTQQKAGEELDSPTNKSGHAWLDFCVSGKSGSTRWRNWIQYMFVQMCTVLQLLISWLFFLTIQNVVSFTRATHQGRKGNGRRAPTPICVCVPTITFMSGRVFLLNLSEMVVTVGGPQWQPVAARLRISPPQGQDYNIIKMNKLMSSKCLAEGI